MRRFRRWSFLPCCYQLLVILATLFWVRGFVLPSDIHLVSTSNEPSIDLAQNHRLFATRPTDDASGTTTQGHGITIKKKQRRSWDEYFPLLEAFYAKHGHSNVTAQDDDDLFQFVSSLRKNYRRQVISIRETRTASRSQQLPTEKMEALENIDFIWYIPRTKKTWKEYYPRLKDFYNQHGHCNVTSRDDKDLSQYLASLRNNYAPPSEKSSSKRKLSDDKLQALQDLGFSWEKAKPPRSVRPGGRTWEEYFPKLRDFHKEHGHTNVTPKDDPDLFQYVSSLRKNYRHQYVFTQPMGTNHSSFKGIKYKKLSPERFQALQDLNFSWYNSESSRNSLGEKTLKYRSRRPRRMWQEYYPKLRAFREEYGHCNVTSANDKDLYQWLKSLERRHKLPNDKLRALEDLGVKLLKPSERKRLVRDEMIPMLLSHLERFGRVAVDKKEDPYLSEWTTKYVRQNGYPSLWELLGYPPTEGKWKPGQWESMFEELVEHHRTTGTCNVDATWNSPLDYFVRDQRKEYLRWRTGLSTVLTIDRIESLEAIGFKWVKHRPRIRKTHEERWNEMIGELSAYREKHGHTEIPQEYDKNPQLGRWVMNQRTFYRMNQIGIYTSLTDDRIEQLESLDFVWGVREKHWWTMYGRLKDYQNIHGHLVIEVSDFVNEDLRQWLNEQRYFYRSKTKGHRLSRERIEALQSLPGFRWSGKRAKIPTKDDWSQLLGAIRDRGITPDTKPKEHWFDGVNRFEDEVKSVYSDEELLALWNEENDPDDDNGDNNYFDDEDSRLFLRA